MDTLIILQKAPWDLARELKFLFRKSPQDAVNLCKTNGKTAVTGQMLLMRLKGGEEMSTASHLAPTRDEHCIPFNWHV